MGKPRRKGRKAAYFILVLLILLVVAIIGGLSAVLFNMKPAQPRRPSTVAKTERVMLTNTVGNVTPTADVHIEIPPEQTPKPRVEEPSADGGIIPTVCDGYGPQIQNRRAYWGPTTYDANVQPNRVRFTIHLPDRQQNEGPNNIR